MIDGRIIKHISNQYVVMDLENLNQYQCVAMGKLRKGLSPIVGDYVKFQQLEDKWAIQKIMPRKNELTRPVIANIDQAIVVMSAVDPDFSCALLDRLLFLICYENIKPIICITKLDLIDKNNKVYEYIADYEKSGYEVHLSGEGYPVDDIVDVLANKISVLTGQSGAGKSSLINRIDPNFALHTQETSKALGRGKHTTRHCELFQIGEGWLGDTPGFSSLDFSTLDEQRLASSVYDFRQYQGHCKFNDCIHMNEPNCAIKEGVEEENISEIRYKNYKEVMFMVQNTRKKF